MVHPHPWDEGVFSLRSRLSLYFCFGADSVPRGFWAAFCMSVLLVYLCIFVSFHFCYGARTNYPFKPNPRSVKGRYELPTASRLRSKRTNGIPFAVPNGQPLTEAGLGMAPLTLLSYRLRVGGWHGTAQTPWPIPYIVTWESLAQDPPPWVAPFITKKPKTPDGHSPGAHCSPSSVLPFPHLRKRKLGGQSKASHSIG